MHATLDELAAFPGRLEALYDAVPAACRHWAPDSWDGLNGETFTALEHVCHVRDIEIDGYHVRLRRALTESNPELASIDGYAFAQARSYGTSDADDALARFRSARAETLRLIQGLGEEQFGRPARFEGADVTVRGLVHTLCRHDYLHLAGLQWLLAKIDAARGVRAS
jgi:hypothetical protein